MIFKESRSLVSAQCGIFLVRVFHLYNKKASYLNVGGFGISSNKVVSSQKYFLKKKKNKFFFIRTKGAHLYMDGSKLSFNNKFVVLLKKRLYIKGVSTFGPIPYNIKRRKVVSSFIKKI